jgi:hypothetical protein
MPFSPRVSRPYLTNFFFFFFFCVGSKKMVEAAREDVVKFLDVNWMKIVDMTV